LYFRRSYCQTFFSARGVQKTAEDRHRLFHFSILQAYAGLRSSYLLSSFFSSDLNLMYEKERDMTRDELAALGLGKSSALLFRSITMLRSLFVSLAVNAVRQMEPGWGSSLQDAPSNWMAEEVAGAR
jgi:hypothetical protein